MERTRVGQAGRDSTSPPASGRRREGRGRRLGLVLAFVLVAVALLAACVPAPGQARVRLSGDVDGRGSGPTTTCEGPDPIWLYNAAWHWTGVVDGASTSVNVYRFGLDHVVVVDRGTRSWDGYPEHDAVQQSGDSLRVEAELRDQRVTENTAPTMRLTIALTCPD